MCEKERVVGGLESSFVCRRAVLGHSIVDGSTRQSYFSRVRRLDVRSTSSYRHLIVTTDAASDADDAATCRTASAETPPSQPAMQMMPVPATRHRSSRPILAEVLFVCATRPSFELISSHQPRSPRLYGSLSCRAHRL